MRRSLCRGCSLALVTLASCAAPAPGPGPDAGGPSPDASRADVTSDRVPPALDTAADEPRGDLASREDTGSPEPDVFRLDVASRDDARAPEPDVRGLDTRPPLDVARPDARLGLDAPADVARYDVGRPDGGPPADAPAVLCGTGPRVPNPRLAALADNTALDLGAYDCRPRFEEATGCGTITDYSRLNYDPCLHRVLMFGGGHAATARTDVDVLDLTTLRWSSLYPSMTCAETTAGDVDPRGFHRATGHPVARHTYDQNVVAQVGGVGRFVVMSTEGFGGRCHPYELRIRSVAHLELVPGNTTFRYSAEYALPWSYAAAAEFDPISGMILMLGNRDGGGEGGMWVVDPATGTPRTFVDAVGYGDIASDLVYYPPNGRMYYFQRATIVREVVLDRADWSRTRSARLTTSGPAPATGFETGYAYDSRARVIGGAIAGGQFYAFDPVVGTWQVQTMNVVSDVGATPGRLTFHNLDYDPVDNVYFFIADGSMGRRTWAYRFRR